MTCVGRWPTGSWHRRLWRWSVVCLLFSAGLLAQNIQARESLAWEQLSATEQAVLQPFRQSWGKFDDATRNTMRRWAGLSTRERSKIRQRHLQWQALSAASKVKIIRKLDRYKRMPLAKRLRLQTWRNWVRRLPSAEQSRLHQRWPSMGSKERKEYILNLEKKYGKP